MRCAQASSRMWLFVVMGLTGPVFDGDASTSAFGNATNREPRGVTNGAFVRFGSAGLSKEPQAVFERFENLA